MNEDFRDATTGEFTTAQYADANPDTTVHEGGTCRLHVVGVQHTSITFPGDDGDTLVIDRNGTDVPADDVDRLIELAAQHGVTITEVG